MTSGFTEITSSANERVKRWKKLAGTARSIRKERAALAEGLHLAMAARDADFPVNAVLLREGLRDRESGRLAEELCSRGARGFLLSAGIYEELAPVKNGAGIMTELALPENPQAPRGADVLYLDGVQDAGNAGTLIRTAVAAGVKVIAAHPKTVELWSPKVLRSAMGAHFGAVILEGVTAEELKVRFSGTRLAADARGGRDIYETEGWEKGSTVWMMGAEGPGLSEAALAESAMRLYIPIAPETESLNVAAAAAVCLFEQHRRRLAAERKKDAER